MLTALLALLVPLQVPDSSAALVRRVEIVRTAYGIPHILADDVKAMGFAMGYAQSEDYGDVVAIGLEKARGTYARHVGIDSIDGDFIAREVDGQPTILR